MKKTILLVAVGILLGSSVTFAVTKTFSDVPADAWYKASVINLTSRGIINGYQDGTFAPDKGVSRAELSVIIDRTLSEVKKGCSYENKIVLNGEEAYVTETESGKCVNGKIVITKFNPDESDNTI